MNRRTKEPSPEKGRTSAEVVVWVVTLLAIAGGTPDWNKVLEALLWLILK